MSRRPPMGSLARAAGNRHDAPARERPETGPHTFRATCKRRIRPERGSFSEGGEPRFCDEVFTGPEGAAALDRHRKEVHGDTTRNRAHGPAPSWASRKTPTPWKAPRPTKGGLSKVAERIAAGEYRWPFPESAPVVEDVEVGDDAA